MANSIPSNPGFRTGGTAGNTDLLLDLFGGEIQAAYERLTVMRDKHRVFALTNGKTLRFPRVGRATATYHTPGTEIVGKKIDHDEIVLPSDDKLIADVFLADIHEMLILANSFDSLVTFRLIQALHPHVSLEPITIGRQAVWQGRDLTINYFAEDHRAGATFFETTDAGKQAVKVWCDWVRANVGPDHYWAANKKRGDLKLPGVQVSPKIAGSNEFRDLTQCSILYSAKASGPENRVFAELTGGRIDADDVRRDREFEDLVQIVFRSSLRMPDDTRPVMLTVYDKDQATFLADYFEAARFPFRMTLNHIDLGLTYTKEKPGRKVDPLKPPMSAVERAAAYRARKAAAAQ